MTFAASTRVQRCLKLWKTETPGEGGVGGGGVLLVILSEDGCQDALRGSSSFADDGFKKGEKATERTKKSDLTADVSERLF